MSLPQPPLSKILIINPFGIGDVLFTTPLLQNLVEQIPGVQVGYWVNPRGAEAVAALPGVAHVFVYDRDEFQAVYRRSKTAFFKKWRKFYRDIRDARFDTVFDFGMNPNFTLLCRWAGIRRRIGFNYKRRGRFLTQSVPLRGYEGRHVADYYLDLLPLAGLNRRPKPLQIAASDASAAEARQYFQQNGIDGRKPVVAFFPGGGASWGKDARYKRWPAKRFAGLADKMIAHFTCKVILMGNRDEIALCQEVRSAMKEDVLLLAGQSTLSQTVAVLRECRCAVMNDGGPLHLAVAAGIPTVSIFGPVDDRVYGPYPREGHEVAVYPVACRPCYRNFRRAACSHIACLRDLSVDTVYQHTAKLLSSPR